MSLGNIGDLFKTADEQPQQIEALISGTIPTWIKGGLLRNGPGKFEVGKDKYNHWFDGLSLIHRFDFDNGVVKYHSRFLESDSRAEAIKKNRIVVTEFGTVTAPDPCMNIFQRFASYFTRPTPTDNNAVSITPLGDGVYAATDSRILRRINPETLDTGERVDISQLVAVNVVAAHPHTDPDGTYYNLGTNIKSGCYHVIKISPGANKADPVEGAEILHTIPMENSWKPAYYHSFSMTVNYIIFHEQPYRLNALGLLTRNFSRKGIDKFMEFDPSLKSIFHICDKRTGEVRLLKYVTKPFVNFHTINAYEKDDHLIVDVCAANDGGQYDTLYLRSLGKLVDSKDLDKQLTNGQLTHPRRFLLPLNISKDGPRNVNLVKLEDGFTSATATLRDDGFVHLTYEPLHDDEAPNIGFDFPRMNYNFYNGRPYRYCYGMRFTIPADRLMKLDVQNKTMQEWQEDDCYPSEPIFVPAPDALKEDEGVVLSLVLSPSKDKSTFLLVLDGESFKELGRATIPYDVPYGLHGAFV
ncbi:unnamed protein product [Owenia fusiformis]|uniref:Carotenoid-cleaving dioxygenase, mitochondrial n=1 Tax=Owenia fusiformis TaxID=6347 RepID=A0A8S4N2J5_OWEFU|nr:unnamed protein product [Owenia fusiformis]